MFHRFLPAMTLLSASAACTVTDPSPPEPAIPAAARVQSEDSIAAEPAEAHVLPQAVIASDGSDPRVRAAAGSRDPVVARPGGSSPEPRPVASACTPTDSAASFQTGAVVGEVALALDEVAVFVDAPEVGATATVRDPDGAMLADVVVAGTLSGDDLGPAAEAQCTTGADGTCLLVFELADEAFVAGGPAEVSAAAGSVVASAPLTVFAAPEALAIDAPGAGVQLPISPRYEGEVFDATVFIETLWGTPAAYDVELLFDASRLEVLEVTAGPCPGFGEPVHNGHAGANAEGRLLMNAINPSGADCAEDGRVQVAVVRFAVRSGAAAGGSLAVAAITGTLRDLYDTAFSQLADDKPVALADAFGTSQEAEVLIR